MMSENFLKEPTQVVMARKSETKSAITRLLYEISMRSLRPSRGFRGRAIEGCQKNSTTANLVAMATIFETKSDITRLVYEVSRRSFGSTRVFVVRLLNDVTQIPPRPTLVAMATKFKRQNRQ